MHLYVLPFCDLVFSRRQGVLPFLFHTSSSDQFALFLPLLVLGAPPPSPPLTCALTWLLAFVLRVYVWLPACTSGTNSPNDVYSPLPLLLGVHMPVGISMRGVTAFNARIRDQLLGVRGA